MSGQLGPRGEIMRDCSNHRAGFDCVLMAVAATFLTVSAGSVLGTGAGRSVAQQCSRACDRRRDSAPRARQCSASDRQRFQAGRGQARHHRGRGRSGKDNREGRGDQALRRRRRAGRRYRQAGDRQGRNRPDRTRQDRARQKRHRENRSGRRRTHPASGRGCRSAGRRAGQGADQGRTSNVAPADQPVADRLRDSWRRNPRIISTARPSGLRWRNSTAGATLPRYGRRAAR